MINFTFDFNGIILHVEASVDDGEFAVVNKLPEECDAGEGPSANIIEVYPVDAITDSFNIDGVSLNGVDLAFILEQEAIAKYMARCL